MQSTEQQGELPADLETLLSGARQIGLELSPEQLAQFARYRELLLDWNQRVNLTSITGPQEVLTKHFLDSLACLFVIPSAYQPSLHPAGGVDLLTPAGWETGGTTPTPAGGDAGAITPPMPQREQPLKLLDVGSGAGLPGLPLQIVFPHWQVTLLEATGKKVRFLEEVITRLGLSRARALQGRAEDVAHDRQHRARYDLVTARGVAPLPTLLEYCLPFCRPGGLVIAPKKGAISAEVAQGTRAAAALGGRFVEQRPFSLPGLEDQRLLVVFQATRATPAQYPRRAGAAVKKPLG